MRSVNAALAAAVAMWASCASAAAPVQSYETYRDWFAACDNTLSCVAKTVSDDSQSQMTLNREGGPGGKTKLEIATSPAFKIANIRVDGKPLAGSAQWSVKTEDDTTTATLENFAAISAVAKQLRNATRITLGRDRAISLSGFAAALLRIDDRQGRIGNKTGLARPGELPPSAVPAPIQPPYIAYHPIKAELGPGEAERLGKAVISKTGQIATSEDCEAESLAKPAEVHPLDADRALVFVECLMGAYQSSSLVFIASRRDGTPTRLELDAPYLGGSADEWHNASFTTVSFDEKTGELGSFTKGRGIGDCGTSASWIWNGTTFVFSELSLQNSCGGVYPDDWPVLFRSVH